MYLLQFSQCAVHLQCTSKMSHTFITNLFKWNTLEEHNKSFDGTSGGIKTLSSYLNEVKWWFLTSILPKQAAPSDVRPHPEKLQERSEVNLSDTS